METKKTTQKVDRVVLDQDTMTVLNTLIDQVRNELGDNLDVNVKMITNFLLRKRSEPFTQSELKQLNSENHDIVKALKRATQLAIKSKGIGSKFDYEDALKIIQTPSVIEKLPASPPRERKKKLTTSESNQMASNTASEAIKEK